MTQEDVLELALIVLVIVATLYAVWRVAWWIGGKIVLWAFRPPKRRLDPQWWASDDGDTGDDDDRRPAA